ncbi:AAA family ATPase [Chitinophaga sp. SYP-B3965]|uniref:ATP-dependent nuclease n=1 Tax=Chitinophaga sp. SYP-B3965 TaxID=2663120 RepID=UPI00129956D5|nr:AAA family ATPase [Chitinophaga sp. SYP-B3965]MRG45354.1 AAA family ATPase [Chitinophaga sp. SYP-B3965]
MPHILSKITITNYKSIINQEFELSEFTPLIGYNNAGKTNILTAIKWLLRRSSLGQECFHDIANPVIVEGIINGIDANLLQNLPQNHRNAISTFIVNETLHLKRIQNQPNESATNIKLLIRDPNSTNPATEWRSNPAGIDNALNALFPDPIHIGAMENAEEDVSKSKQGTTIGKLLAEIIEPIENQYGAQVQQTLQGLKDLLEADGQGRAQELDAFDLAVNQKIDTFFPNVNIRLHVPTPELKDVFSKGTIKVYEHQSPTGRDVSSLGHGAQRSIQMALVQHLSEIKRNNQNPVTTTLLLIDEPELYLHPQAIEVVRNALKILSTQGYQIIFSTHSALMLNQEDVANAILIRKNIPLGTYKRQTLKAAIPQIEQNAPSQLELMFSLSNASNILFSERVILTEGRTEQRIFPKLIETVSGRTLGLLKYALVKQGGVTNTRKSMMVLDAMDLPTKAIVDLDYVFKNAVGDGFLQANNPDLLAIRNHLAQIAVANNITLGNDNWPTSNPNVNAANAFSILAAEQQIYPNINNLHTLLVGQNIWFWKSGAIENHLGLTGKTEQIWAAFVNQITQNQWQTVIADPNGIQDCVTWLTT